MGNTNNMKQAVYEVFGISLGTEEHPTQEQDFSVVAQQNLETSVPAEIGVAPVAAPYTLRPVSYLAEGTVFEGTLHSEGDVEIAARFYGDIIAKGSVTLHSTAEGNVTAGTLLLENCCFVGNTDVAGHMHLSHDSSVTGNVAARSLHCAGTIRGDLNISCEAELEASARVYGSTSAGSLSMEQGAVLCGEISISKDN